MLETTIVYGFGFSFSYTRAPARVPQKSKCLSSRQATPPLYAKTLKHVTLYVVVLAVLMLPLTFPSELLLGKEKTCGSDLQVETSKQTRACR